VLFLPNRPRKLGSRRTVPAPLQLCGDAAVTAVLSLCECDFEAHRNHSSSNRAPVKSRDPKLTHYRISHISTAIHTICTTPAPCSEQPSRLPSNRALFLRSKPARHAPFRKIPQPKPLIFAASRCLHPVNMGIRTANTTCCALYLTDPIEGVTFTTATPQTFGWIYLHPASLTPTTPHPGSMSQRHEARKDTENTTPDLQHAVSQKLDFFIKIEGVFPHGDHPQPDPGPDPRQHRRSRLPRPPRRRRSSLPPKSRRCRRRPVG